MTASLNKKLSQVEWGEYKYKDVFDRIEQGQRLKKEDQISGEIPFVMAGTTNFGIANYVSNPVARFPRNAITVDIFGNAFYRNCTFGAGDDTGVYWNSKKIYSPKAMLFMTTAIKKSLEGRFSFGKKLRSSQSFDFTMKLPTRNGKIDFEFMEDFITELETQRFAELEAQQIAEREAYLSVGGLKDIKLSLHEEHALENFEGLEWGLFNVEELYGKSTRGKRLKSADRVPGALPFVTAGEAEEGISDFIGNNVQIFSCNTTTIDMFGSAKYRNYEYGADDHIAVVHTEHLPKLAAIFVTAAIHKASHTGKFKLCNAHKI